MDELDQLSRQARDMLECRVEAVLDAISTTPLVDLAEEEPVTVEEFIRRTQLVCSEAAVSISRSDPLNSL